MNCAKCSTFETRPADGALIVRGVPLSPRKFISADLRPRLECPQCKATFTAFFFSAYTENTPLTYARI